MAFLRLLGRVEIGAIVATVLASAFLATVALAQTLAGSGGDMLSPSDSAKVVFLYSLTLGAPLAILYGAPLYAFLFYRSLASWLAALLVGLAPGAAIYFLVEHEQLLGLWVAGGGSVTALLTHLSTCRFASSPPRSNSAPHRDGREALQVGQPSSAPARGRER